MRLKIWVRVVITLIMIISSFFIWKQTGTLGELAQNNTFYLFLCISSWLYITAGQILIYKKIWK